MKLALYTFAVAASMFFFSSCQKENITPQTTNAPVVMATTVASDASLTQSDAAAAALDTVKGCLRIQLAKNATSTDNILINFTPLAKATYAVNEDAAYLKGLGVVNLSSLTTDGKACAINTLPLTAQGRSVALNVNANADGAYKLNMLTIQSIPANFNIYIKDNYLKDSVDFRKNPSYSFNVTLKNATTYGANRFSVVLHKK